jgi:hypothetical protein
MEAVTARDHRGVDTLGSPGGVAEGDVRAVAADVMQGHVVDLVEGGPPGALASVHQIRCHLRLPVDPDRTSSMLDEVEVVPLAGPL